MHLPLACLVVSALASPASLRPDEITERIDAYLAPFLADGHLSGTVLVGGRDEVLFEKAYGMANYEHSVPNRITTRHGIASISKPMTIAIAIRMMERGDLAQTDKIERWLPEFPRADRITVEHLLRHRAGIPHRVTGEDDEGVPRTAAEMVELAALALASEGAFLCEPGVQSNYSSAGFSVLARVLELASNETYETLLHELVCKPAGMERTSHVHGRTILPDRAQSYMPGARGLVNAPLKDLSFLVGAGSAYSTARDLFAFLTAVRTGKLGGGVQASMLDASGLDWNGATNGFRAYADYHAEDEISVVVVANLTTGALDRMRADLPRIVRGEDVDAPKRLGLSPVALTPEELAQYAGEYEMRPGSSFDARVEAGELVVGSYLLVPIGADRFFSIQDYAEVTAVRDDEGRILHVDWNGTIMRKIR